MTYTNGTSMRTKAWDEPW